MTDEKGVITVILRGKQTAKGMHEIGLEVQKQADVLRAQHKKVLNITDIRLLKASDSTNAARAESKKLVSLKNDAAAVIGNPGLIGVAMYAMRLTKNNAGIRFFTNERQARAWISNVERFEKRRRRPSASLIVGVLIGLVGLLALIGWQTGNAHLTRGLPWRQLVNPITAIGLLIVGYSLICHWLDKARQLKILGAANIVLGILLLLPLGVDSLLFSSKVIASGSQAHITDMTAMCFILFGLLLFTTHMQKPIVRLLKYSFCLVIIFLSVYSIFAQLYARELIYEIDADLLMSLNVSVAFLAAGISVFTLLLYRQGKSIISGVSRIGWLVMAVLALVQVATYAAWTQAIEQNKSNASEIFLSKSTGLQTSLERQTQAYINALHGFNGLYAASDEVDQGEFQAYYNSLNLNATYPGLRALSFVAHVSEKDLPTFLAKHRKDSSLNPGANPTFNIVQKADSDTHYIVTYSATSNVVTGNDLSSNPSRLVAFKKATLIKQPVSSGTVEFAATSLVPAQTGFFLTIPVGSKTSGGIPVGFVNTAFNYDDFFAHTFTQGDFEQGLGLTIKDSEDGTKVYASRNQNTVEETAFSRRLEVTVADRSWEMNISAPATYGINAAQAELPNTILYSGQGFSILILIIFVLQVRARRQGFALADLITEDLAYERNQAVTNAQKSSAILSSIGDAVFAVDTHQRVTLFNPSAQRISGYTEAEVLGKHYDEILRFEFEKDGRINNRFIHEALGGHMAAMANHTVLLCKDGRKVPVADSAAPIMDASHKVQGAIIVFRDVSKDYELDKAKSEFVSLASHQLRTPLSAINWYGEMLLNGDAGKLTKDQEEYIREIFEGNQRMIELVNSLLDVSRLEVGKMADQPASTSITELLESLEKELASSIVNKQLIVTSHIDDIPLVMADPKQLRMILQNILSNAVKYTPEKGEITITLRKAIPEDMTLDKVTSPAPHWFFSVQDTGYGIPKAEQAKIFSKLYRADNVRKLDVEGTGLGLYIVKEIVKKLGGFVRFTSVENAGTTFYVVLPFKGGSKK